MDNQHLLQTADEFRRYAQMALNSEYSKANESAMANALVSIAASLAVIAGNLNQTNERIEIGFSNLNEKIEDLTDAIYRMS